MFTSRMPVVVPNMVRSPTKFATEQNKNSFPLINTPFLQTENSLSNQIIRGLTKNTFNGFLIIEMTIVIPSNRFLNETSGSQHFGTETS